MDVTREDTREWVSEDEAQTALSRSSIAMVLTDPRQKDNPIVYVNRAFTDTTGYTAEQVLGRNCRFLQGAGTDPSDVDALREAMARGQEISIDIQNYRADGSGFLNRLTISPVRDEGGEIVHFLGIQKVLREIDYERRRPPADKSMVELQHRVKNHLAMIVSLVRMQARGSKETLAFSTLARRVESLQLLYEELGRPEMGGRSRISLDAYLDRIASAVSHLDGRASIRVDARMDSIYTDTETAMRLGLILSEILTNCLQHAFVDREDGQVEITVARCTGAGVHLAVVDDGVGLPPGTDWPDPRSLGGRIVIGLVDALNGNLNVTRNAAGTAVSLTVPEIPMK